MPQTFEQYLQRITEEFTMQHFETFYFDVIYRDVTLDQYLHEDRLYENHVEDLASYDFVQLRDMLDISRKEAIRTGTASIVQKVKEPLLKRIENNFVELLNDKRDGITEDLKEDDLTQRDIQTLNSHKENITRAINHYHENKKGEN